MTWLSSIGTTSPCLQIDCEEIMVLTEHEGAILYTRHLKGLPVTKEEVNHI